MSGNITRDSLVALFIDTANNVDKSIDFDLHYVSILHKKKTIILHQCL